MLLNSLKLPPQFIIENLVKKITLICLLLTISSWVNAKTIYITDNVNINLRSSDSSKSKVIATLPSGTALTYVSKGKNSKYTKVRMPNGRYAFILTNNTLNEPTDKIALASIVTERDKLKQEIEELENELLMQKGNSTAAETTKNALTLDHEKLTQELEDIRYSAANAIKIKEQRDILQEEVVQAQKDLEQLKLENQTLKANIKLDWFLYGGTAVFFSIILGFLLPNLGWHKRSHSWH